MQTVCTLKWLAKHWNPCTSTNAWVSSLELIYQAFTAATFRYLTLLFKNISCICIKKLLGCFQGTFWVIIHLCCNVLSYGFCSLRLNLNIKHSAINSCYFSQLSHHQQITPRPNYMALVIHAFSGDPFFIFFPSNHSGKLNLVSELRWSELL